MPTTQELLTDAIQHHQAGRLHETELICRQILAADPQHAQAWNLLGVIACQVGQFEAGVGCFRQSLSFKPDWPETLNNLGNAFRELNQFDDAARCFQQAIRLRPDFASAHCNLGVVFAQQGDLNNARTCYQNALRIRPDYAEAHNNLGSIWRSEGHLVEARSCYERALQSRPDFKEARENLAALLQSQNELVPFAVFQNGAESSQAIVTAYPSAGSAQDPFRRLMESSRASKSDTDHAREFFHRGCLELSAAKLDDAVDSFQQALNRDPDFAEAHNNLGTALLERRDLDEAIFHYERAIQLRPDFAEAYSNLGIAFTVQRKPDEAVAVIEKALQLKPDYADAHNNLGNACLLLGRLDEAAQAYRHALNLNPSFIGTHSNLLLTLQYREGITLSELATAHREFDQMHAEPLRQLWQPFENIRDAQRPLKIGFVTSDFARHPVGYFLMRILENLDTLACQTVCYNDRVTFDDLTSRCQAAMTDWRNVNGLNDHALAEQIRADRVDILFDLAGHTSRNRLMVFARKPAPIQMTWAGYMGTTGLQSMDYILADRHEIPEGADPMYCERVLRMPDGYVTYDPPDYAPSVSPLPAIRQGHVTFGSFNNPAKMNSLTIKSWARVLNRVPRSRLILKYTGLSDDSIRNRLASAFSNQGIDLPGRDICQPSFSEPSFECGIDRNNRREHRRLRGPCSVIGWRFTSAGQSTSGTKATSRRVTALRRKTIRSKFDGDPARRVA